ncbi:carbohydrate ABC transporter permease [Diaminobutyricibacter sp. McL0618]|uniref:carbohydrate ABC transporter permease n=1 Tax=Leifsonia sp. McL0618 TaxID=3415677 RepID=UPI003CF51ACA
MTTSTLRRTVPRQSGVWIRRRRSLTGLAFIAPALIFMALAMLWPLALSVSKAFFRDDPVTNQPVFSGFKNFAFFFSNASLIKTLPTTLIFVVGATAIAFILGMLWALVLEQIRRGRSLLRALTLIPWVLPSVVTAFLWAWIFNGQFGVLNGVGRQLGLVGENIIWLADPTTANIAIIIARAWQSMPWFALMFIAGLQSVPTELTEAVRVDGGGNWQVFRTVILPHLRFTVVIALILGAMGNLQLFDLIYAMTGGGPAGSTSVMSLVVYQQAFQVFDFGTAAAIGVIWILLLLVPTILYVRTALPSRKGA